MTSGEGRIRIVLVCGSVRPGNYTRMAVDVVAASLSTNPDVSVEVIDPSHLDLPLPGLPAESDSVAELQETVRGATAVILATPEYHGSFSSVMKLVIENLGFPSVLGGKPVALLGVAGGRSEPSSRWSSYGACALMWAQSFSRVPSPSLT